MKIMWNREKIARSVLTTVRRMVIAAVTLMLLTDVSTGKDETKCGKVKSSTHIRRRQRNLLTKFPGATGQA